MPRLVRLRERAWRYNDVDSPYRDATIQAALRAMSEQEVAPMTETETGLRYPQTVAAVEELAAQMEHAASRHGRVGVCGWICLWVHPTRVVAWKEAQQLVDQWRRGEEQNSKIVK